MATTKQFNTYGNAGSIDPVNDLLLEFQNSSGTLKNINRNVFLGLSSQPLGLTDTQSPTNKTLNNTNSITVLDGSFTLQNTGSTTRQAIFSLSSITAGNTRTITIPDASGTLALLSANNAFTGTNSFTGSSWSGGTISNTTISSDTISGYTTSNSGTIYGVAITTGQISGTNTVLPAALVTGVPTTKLFNASKFCVYRNASLTASTVTVVFDTKIYDTGTNFSTTSGLFTAPVAGFYHFELLLTYVANTSPNECFAQIIYNGSNTNQPFVIDFSETIPTNNAHSAGWDVLMAANDTIGVTAGGGIALVTGVTRNRFSGFLVSTT